jgi:hypothetical protein
MRRRKKKRKMSRRKRKRKMRRRKMRTRKRRQSQSPELLYQTSVHTLHSRKGHLNSESCRIPR